MATKLIACNCNKKNLLYMTDVDENTYRYTATPRYHELECSKDITQESDFLSSDIHIKKILNLLKHKKK